MGSNKTWAPDRRRKPTVPDPVKTEVQRRGEELIEKHLKPRYVKPPPKNERSNYLTGIHTKWHRSFFYLVADYASPSPNARSPTYEVPFTRLEYVQTGTFNLAYLYDTPESGGRSTRD